MKAKRLVYGALFLVLLLAEICIALFVHDAFVRPYLGDVLVTVLLCAFCRIFVPEKVRLLPLYVFIFAAAVETAQYFDFVELLGLENSTFISVWLGRVFSVYDLLCYGAGCLLFVATEYIIKRKLEIQKMRNYKIIASDLDGTLLNNESRVSDENMAAIAQLLDRGVYFVPCSGRTLSEIPAVIRNDSSIRYFIHSNGAVVLDRQTGERILTCIPNAVGREILDVLTACECHITIRHNGNCIVDRAYQNDVAFDYYNVIEAHRDCVLNYAIQSDDFLEYAYAADQVEVFSAFFHSYEDKLACKKQLEKSGKLRVVEASEYNIEIVNVDAGKGNALYALADMLGVDRADTISIGDSDNDSSITQAAGLGLAVSNACDSLKAVADQIICSNEEHAIAYVLSRYFGRG